MAIHSGRGVPSSPFVRLIAALAATLSFGLALPATATNSLGPEISAQPLLGGEFPDNCLFPLGFSTPVGATTGWSVDYYSYSGTCSLRSNPAGNSSKAQIQVTGNFNSSALRFAARVSSESNLDCLRVFVDNVETNIGLNCAFNSGLGISGETDWTLVTIPVPDGVHTILWSYEKDVSSSGGEDAAWIDEVEIVSVAPFPPSCFSLPEGWVVPVGATAWSVAADSVGSGTCSLKSGPIPHNGKSQIEYTSVFEEGTVSFAHRVSSEFTFDCLKFFIDGVQQDIGGNCFNNGVLGVSGLGGWGTVEIPLAAGQHTLRWSYEKDGSVVAGSDAAWIDNVSLPFNARPPSAPYLDFVSRDTEGHATFSAFPPDEDGGSPIEEYILEWRQPGGSVEGQQSYWYFLPSTLHISGLDHGPYIVSLRARNAYVEGPATEVNMQADACGAPAEGYSVAASSYDNASLTFTFGTRPVLNPGSMSVTVENNDGFPATVSLWIEGEGDFSANNLDECGFLGAFESCQVTINFSPQAAGPRTGILQITGPTDRRCTSETTPYTLTGMGVKLNQTITFAPLATRAFTPTPFDVPATVTSNLPITFSSLTPAVCTVAGSSVSLAGIGTCTLAANQEGNEQYNPAPQVMQSFNVTKGNQAITFNPLSGKTFLDPAFPVSATASSNLAVTFSSLTTAVCTVATSTVTIVAAGTCTIAANQAGNTNYNAAPQVTQSFTVAKASQAITFAALLNRALNQGGFTATATTSSQLAIVFSSLTPSICTISAGNVTLLAIGTCTIAANQAGDANYLAAPQVTRSFEVTAATIGQTITFNPLGNKTLGDPAFSVSTTATASSGLTVTFSSLTTAVCTVATSTVSLVATGTCTIAANQAGNATYLAAPQVTQSFEVTAPANPSRLFNISTRGQVLGGAEVMIPGFVIVGDSPKKVVVTVKGPSLTPLGVPNALADPTLQLVRSSDQTTIGTSDNWGDAPNKQDLIDSGFAPGNALEPAILANLPQGAYTAIVSGANGTTGVGLVEVYEVDRPDVPLINISTRGWVGAGNDVMIGGFVILGSGPQTVVIVARGPSLSQFGIPNALANPQFTLVRSSDGVAIATIDNWGDAPNKQDLINSGFAPGNALEPALLVTLSQGAYTVIVSGVANSGGIALLEVYALD